MINDRKLLTSKKPLKTPSPKILQIADDYINRAVQHYSGRGGRYCPSREEYLDRQKMKRERFIALYNQSESSAKSVAEIMEYIMKHTHFELCHHAHFDALIEYCAFSKEILLALREGSRPLKERSQKEWGAIYNPVALVKNTPRDRLSPVMRAILDDNSGCSIDIHFISIIYKIEQELLPIHSFNLFKRAVNQSSQANYLPTDLVSTIGSFLGSPIHEEVIEKQKGPVSSFKLK